MNDHYKKNTKQILWNSGECIKDRGRNRFLIQCEWLHFNIYTMNEIHSKLWCAAYMEPKPMYKLRDSITE